MLDLLHDLSDWLVEFAGTEWAVVVLGITSFFESIFFPVPPDPLLIAMGILQPPLAVWFAALVTIASVAGAVVGHWLGQRLGRPFVYRLFPEARVQQVERMFQKYGGWAVVVAAFTPIPYKVFAISAGVMDLDRRTFVVASLVGRGGRFLTIGVLITLFGEDVTAFVSENFGALTLAAAAAVLAGAGVWALVQSRRRPRDAAH